MRRLGMVIVWTMLCAGSGVAVGQSTKPADAEFEDYTQFAEATEQPGSPWDAIAPQVTPPAEDQILQRRKHETRNATTDEDASATSHWSPMRTLGALAGVVGLIVFLGWGYRAMAGGNLMLLGKNRRPNVIEVICKTTLSAKQSLCLVRVGPRMVLIGQSPDTLRTLDVISDPAVVATLAGDAARRASNSSDAEFQNCLETEARAYKHEEDGEINETFTPEGRRIEDVRQSLTDTIRRIRGVAGSA